MNEHSDNGLLATVAFLALKKLKSRCVPSECLLSEKEQQGKARVSTEAVGFSSK